MRVLRFSIIITFSDWPRASNHASVEADTWVAFLFPRSKVWRRVRRRSWGLLSNFCKKPTGFSVNWTDLLNAKR